MDFTSFLGLFLTIGVVVAGIVVQATGLEQLKYFIDPGSAIVVLGGSLGSTVISMPLQSLAQAGSAIRVAFRERRRDLHQVIRQIVALSEVARRDGILALEQHVLQNEDELLRRALQMAIDGTDPVSVETTLRHELEQSEARHASGRAFLEQMARYAPAYGMLGTVMGLILMLAPAHADAARASASAGQSVILQGMALALVTTFYGVLFSNAVALPLAEKLSEKSREELLYREVVLSGVLAIQNGDNPRVVEQKLTAFLPPSERP
jgi:chemotaxis protein MotA